MPDNAKHIGLRYLLDYIYSKVNQIADDMSELKQLISKSEMKLLKHEVIHIDEIDVTQKGILDENEKKQLENTLVKMNIRNIHHLLIFEIIFWVVAVSKYFFKFQSPFYDATPSQLVFLACIVTSTLALTVIGNRFRDKMNDIKKENLDIIKIKALNSCDTNLGKQLDQRIKDICESYKSCKIGLSQMTFILAVQVVMTCIICFRILLNFLRFYWSDVLVQFIDIGLVLGSVYLFSFLWVHYFLHYGGGEHFFDKKNHNNHTKS
ncbi:hypothetical protein BCS42_06855 [Crenothrix sp. D3]|nr:hypothetical protein BCS42_06855 [Crenothrix sp. D3]